MEWTQKQTKQAAMQQQFRGLLLKLNIHPNRCPQGSRNGAGKNCSEVQVTDNWYKMQGADGWKWGQKAAITIWQVTRERAWFMCCRADGGRGCKQMSRWMGKVMWCQEMGYSGAKRSGCVKVWGHLVGRCSMAKKRPGDVAAGRSREQNVISMIY